MDSNQEMAFLSLRPTILNATTNEHTGDTESFQNKTLRPIIKLLNYSILLTVKNHIIIFKKNFLDFEEEEKILELKMFLKKNQKIRTFLCGMITGFMTSSELEKYYLEPSEYNKRLIQMIEQRVIDHLSFFES